jgi:FtsP/CotA-like multicopper oxidase with cupredoxin domain
LPFKNISFRARTYNGSFPGPPLIAKPGDRVNILLQNRLGENLPNSGCHAPLNQYRAANSTNLHVHGVYEDAEHDNTFLCIEPGSDHLWSYRIGDETGTSTLFYHPHVEGSSSMQVYGGMAGAFEIVDPAQDAALGVDVTQILVLQMLDFNPESGNYIETVMAMNGGSSLPLELHNPENYAGLLLLANGQVNAPMNLGAGRQARLKLINAISGPGYNVNLGFLGQNASDCQLHVLAYDGVYLSAPRRQASVFIPAGGRADVAVMCKTAGVYQIGTVLTGVENYGQMFPADHAMLTLRMHNDVDGAGIVELPKVLPGPPAYYPDLSEVQPEAYHTITLSTEDGANVVDGTPFNGSVSHVAEQHRMQEWYLYGGEASGFEEVHTYHQHMTHFQIMSTSVDTDGLVVAVGDYRDTVALYRDLNVTVRFIPPFTGRMMIHCHVLRHEDMGMMTVVNFTAPTATPPAEDRLSLPAGNITLARAPRFNRRSKTKATLRRRTRQAEFFSRGTGGR